MVLIAHKLRREPKVAQLDFSIRGKHDVEWLEVSMDLIVLMHVAEGGQDLF